MWEYLNSVRPTFAVSNWMRKHMKEYCSERGKVEVAVVDAFTKIERLTVGAYKAVEHTVAGAYFHMERVVVGLYLRMEKGLVESLCGRRREGRI